MTQRVAVVRPYPKVGEIFELTLDGDAPENQPLEMLPRSCYHLGQWEHHGSVVKGKHTRRFKIVELDYCRNFKKVLQKLAAHGKVPEGQWLQAFKHRHPRLELGEEVSIADASWADWTGPTYFPFLDSGFPFNDRGPFVLLCKINNGNVAGRRWLVEVNE